MKNWLLFLLALLAANVVAQERSLLIVGTYTSAGSEGIYVYDFNNANAETKLLHVAPAANPSFLVVSANEKNVFAVSELAAKDEYGGKIISFALDKTTGSLSKINEQSSGGNDPCYVTTDKSGKWVIAGNYSSGSLALLPVGSGGRLGAAVSIITHAGRSIHSGRQNAPHVHATVLSPDEKYLYVPDLGIDKIMIYRFNKRRGRLLPAAMPFVSTKPGSGPRHFSFHPGKKFAYLVEELTGTIAAYRYHKKNGSLSLLQNISTLPAGFTGFAGSADIHVSPNGKFLYASNRGESNSIAIFSIHPQTGALTALAHQPVLGRTPRNFNFDPGGNFLLVANQDTDEVVIFTIDPVTGLLRDSGKRIGVSKPVCLKWVRVL